MPDPVDTDALRETARKAGAAIAAAALNGGRIQMRVPADPDSDTDLLVTALECDALAAADEVDRLRRDVRFHQEHAVQRSAAYEKLRAVIENAPHPIECKRGNSGNTRVPCTCWKADTL